MSDTGRSREPGDPVSQLRAAVERPVVEPAEVRELVREVVSSLKKKGAPPEAVIVTVKRAVLGDTPLITPSVAQRERDKLVDDAVVWCVRDYYAADT
ncbi:MAG: hypothetical protein ACJ8AK_13770 [Gemmatimonadaceae bacterium]